MRNNTFGILIETWADYAVQGPGHLSYPSLVGCLFPSRPSVSASSRMKFTQPLPKTMARFVADASRTLNMEQSLLQEGRIQPKLRSDLDMAELKDFVWDALGEITDIGPDQVFDGENYLFDLVFSDQVPGRFKGGLVTPVLAAFDQDFDEGVSRKLRGYVNQIDDSIPYGRFELFAALFFVSLMGEAAADAVIACGLPLALNVRSNTPVVDGFAGSTKMIECGFSLTQLELGGDGRPRSLHSWEFEETAGDVFVGREGPEVVLVPPAGSAWAVSRSHVCVRVDDDGRFYVGDVSLNGTAQRSGDDVSFLHHAERPLRDGDVLMLAPLREPQGKGVDYQENWENGSVIRFNILRRREG